jgi:hypothetical protein
MISGMERSGDGALDEARKIVISNPKRCRASLATALQNNPVATAPGTDLTTKRASCN